MKNPTPATPVVILFLMTFLSGLFRYVLIGVFDAVWWDEAVYMGLAKNLHDRFVFSFPFGLERFRPILLPLLLSPAYQFGNPELIARAIVLGFSTVSIPAVYYLGRTLYGWRTGLLASLFLSTNSLFLLNGQRLLSESLFITFSSLAIALFYKAVRGDQRLLLAAAFLTGLAALTKNFGLLLPFLYLAFLIFSRSLKRLRASIVSLSILIFLATLLPLFYFDWVNYGNLTGVFLDQIRNVPAAVSYWYFYIQKFPDTFGWNSIFILSGLLLALRKRAPKDILALCLTLVPLLLLNTALYYHMEERYLIPFMPAFFVVGASVVERVRKVDKKVFAAILLVAVVFSSVSLNDGYKAIINDSRTNSVLKEASLYLRDVTHGNDVVASPSYPLVYYYSQRPTIKLPQERNLLYSELNNNHVTYVLVNYQEQEDPAYLAKELQSGSFIKIRGFPENSSVEVIGIFRYVGESHGNSSGSNTLRTASTNRIGPDFSQNSIVLVILRTTWLPRVDA